jgi:hypothetical protein
LLGTGRNIDPVVALNSALRFTPLEIMPRSVGFDSYRVSSPAIAGLEFLTGFTFQGLEPFCLTQIYEKKR